MKDETRSSETKPYNGLRSTGPISKVFNEDCMIGMARYPDKFFDLAVVDPPYGIGINKAGLGRKKGKRLTYNRGDNWDSAPPPPEYFTELFRVSKNQIIWGGNYFTDMLPASPCWISWNKHIPEGMSFADFELAWTSFAGVAREIRIRSSGAVVGNGGGYIPRIHPTQKPIELYAWLLDKFAGDGYRILDTHMGSQSSRIAAYRAGLDYYGWELDPDYFEAGNKRFKEQTMQMQINFDI